MYVTIIISTFTLDIDCTVLMAHSYVLHSVGVVHTGMRGMRSYANSPMYINYLLLYTMHAAHTINVVFFFKFHSGEISVQCLKKKNSIFSTGKLSVEKQSLIKSKYATSRSNPPPLGSCALVPAQSKEGRLIVTTGVFL